MEKNAQGSLEYLLLIGGAVLVGAIVIALIVSTSQSAGTQTQSNIQKLLDDMKSWSSGGGERTVSANFAVPSQPGSLPDVSGQVFDNGFNAVAQTPNSSIVEDSFTASLKSEPVEFSSSDCTFSDFGDLTTVSCTCPADRSDCVKEVLSDTSIEHTLTLNYSLQTSPGSTLPVSYTMILSLAQVGSAPEAQAVNVLGTSYFYLNDTDDALSRGFENANQACESVGKACLGIAYNCGNHEGEENTWSQVSASLFDCSSPTSSYIQTDSGSCLIAAECVTTDPNYYLLNQEPNKNQTASQACVNIGRTCSQIVYNCFNQKGTDDWKSASGLGFGCDNLISSLESSCYVAAECLEEEPQAVCGNGIVETGEQCDGTDLAGQTCQSQGFVGGTLGCNSECAAFDVSQCIQLDSLGVQKTLILPVDFLDSGPRPFTKEKIYDLILAEESPFQNFFKENSYGKLSFSGAVADWYQIQRSKTYCGISIGGDSDNSLSKIITESNIVELAQYSRILVLGNCYGTAFGSVGKESLSLGGKTYQMSYSFVPGVAYLNENSVNNEFIWNSYYKTLAHEVGHNLGAGHANGWDCDDQVLRGNCTHLDLQNSFDTMGYGLYNSTHFNAFYKELFEWIDEDEILTITQTGNYTINPLEAAGSAIKLAKIQIQKTKETPFYIEFRKGIGYDSGLNKPGWAINQEGLMINNIVKENQPYPMTRLLDMSPHPGISYPGEGHWFTDSGSGGATLNKGQSFNDSEDGFQITTIDNNPSQIIFNVTFTQS